MNKKLIFLDIDGTISNLAGEVPQSARRAIREARENGHVVCVCTGRGKGEVYPWLLELDLDGYICGAGGYVEWHHQPVCSEYMSPGLLHQLGEILTARQIMCIFEGTLCNYVHRTQRELYEYHMEELKEHTGAKQFILPEPVEIGDWQEMRQVNKLSYRSRELGGKEIEELLKDQMEYTGEKLCVIEYGWPLGGTRSGEIILDGIHKAHGMKCLLQYLGMNREDTVACGDSMNDFEMLQYAGVGVAMGNGDEKLKAVADLVTDHIDRDGLYKAFRALELI